MSETKIAITGASGYIGSYLSQYLKSQGCHVTTLGRGESADLHFELGQDCSSELLHNQDVLIHCAYDFNLKNPALIRKVNLEGSLKLFKAARDAGVKKIIYFSTTSAFAESLSDYGQVKYELELAAKPYEVTIIRPGLVFGRNAKGIVGNISQLVSKLAWVPLIGNGSQQFYPCHIHDLAQLIGYAVQHELPVNLPIIAACETTVTFKEIVVTLAEARQKIIHTFKVPYSMIYLGLRMAELLGLQLGLRSDSLRYMKRYNTQLDFSNTHNTGLQFRPFTVEALNSD